VGPTAQEAIAQLQNGSIALLENLRFHAQEERNDSSFARSLADLADLYVNDAFSCSHRAHTSVDRITQCLPAFAGPSLLAEIAALSSALESPRRPVIAIVGGSKVSSKLAVLENLVNKVDRLAIGGGMANTFLAAHGHTVGRSLLEVSQIEIVHAIEARAKQAGCQIILPRDVVTASAIYSDAPAKIVSIDQVPDDEMILDIGPLSLADLEDQMADCRTILWNGPLGAFEVHPFGEGTFATARLIADLTASFGITSIAGGGDTVSALNAAGVTPTLTYVSTAGGAFLEWLEGKRLPGIAALVAERPKEKF
jgi:phosphoglycerate kinase